MKKERLGFVHKNRSKKPAKTLDKAISDTVIQLYSSKYKGYNFSHFYDYLIEEENIKVSYHFVYTTLMNNGFSSPKSRKSTKRRLAKKNFLCKRN